MPETTPLIKAALNLRVGVGFDVYDVYEEVYESKWRKGLDGWDKTDAIYLILEDSSCSEEVAYLRVGWKLRVKDKNA